jgi:hypothetical protein
MIGATAMRFATVQANRVHVETAGIFHLLLRANGRESLRQCWQIFRLDYAEPYIRMELVKGDIDQWVNACLTEFYGTSGIAVRVILARQCQRALGANRHNTQIEF